MQGTCNYMCILICCPLKFNIIIVLVLVVLLGSDKIWHKKIMLELCPALKAIV